MCDQLAAQKSRQQYSDNYSLLKSGSRGMRILGTLKSSTSLYKCVSCVSVVQVITGQDGSSRGAQKLRNLRENANYVRQRLIELGCSVSGSFDSPILVRTLASKQ